MRRLESSIFKENVKIVEITLKRHPHPSPLAPTWFRHYIYTTI